MKRYAHPSQEAMLKAAEKTKYTPTFAEQKKPKELTT